MRTIDKYNIGIIIVATIIYAVLCYQTKYRSIFYNNNQLTEDEYRLLYFTTVFGFIYGTILASFQQRYLVPNIKSVWIWTFTLFMCVLLTFSAFYSQIYTDEDTNSFLGKFSYAMVPVLPSLVMMSETSISQILEHGVDPDIIYRNTEVSNDSFDEMLSSD
jgi:peptidoglycan/LPS O-acetylase OafA/YrhL